MNAGSRVVKGGCLVFHGALVAHLLANNGSYPQLIASSESGYLHVFIAIVCCGWLVLPD
jgi:hypothetical protein